jgi:hypothetical protein
MCQKNSDCGRDKWNRRGKCVINKYPNKEGDFLMGDIMMSESQYHKRIGVSHWNKDK